MVHADVGIYNIFLERIFPSVQLDLNDLVFYPRQRLNQCLLIEVEILFNAFFNAVEPVFTEMFTLNLYLSTKFYVVSATSTM